jgi:hypothetical protein
MTRRSKMISHLERCSEFVGEANISIQDCARTFAVVNGNLQRRDHAGEVQCIRWGVDEIRIVLYSLRAPSVHLDMRDKSITHLVVLPLDATHNVLNICKIVEEEVVAEERNVAGAFICCNPAIDRPREA